VWRVGCGYVVVRWTNGNKWSHMTLHQYREMEWDYTMGARGWEDV